MTSTDNRMLVDDILIKMMIGMEYKDLESFRNTSKQTRNLYKSNEQYILLHRIYSEVHCLTSLKDIYLYVTVKVNIEQLCINSDKYSNCQDTLYPTDTQWHDDVDKYQSLVTELSDQLTDIGEVRNPYKVIAKIIKLMYVTNHCFVPRSINYEIEIDIMKPENLFRHLQSHDGWKEAYVLTKNVKMAYTLFYNREGAAAIEVLQSIPVINNN